MSSSENSRGGLAQINVKSWKTFTGVSNLSRNGFREEIPSPNQMEIKSKHRRDSSGYVLTDIINRSVVEDKPIQ